MKLKQKCPKCGGALTLAYRNYRKCAKCNELIPKTRLNKRGAKPCHLRICYTQLGGQLRKRRAEMKLYQDKKGWFWGEGYATSQYFPTEAAAEAAAREEETKMLELGLDPDSCASAGVLHWNY